MVTGSAASVTMEGAAVNLVNNYPDSTATGIAAAVNTSAGDFTFTAGPTPATGPASFTKVGAATPANCAVNYTPAAANAAPTINVITAGC